MSCSNGLHREIKLLKGLSIDKCLQVQKEWSQFFYEQYELYKESFPENPPQSFITECNAEDSHWQWVSKAIALNSDEYIWFSIESEGSLECLMVVYHPQKARSSEEDIFYVDYLAVAPWNRNSVLQKAKIRGLGTTMLKVVGVHLKQVLNYVDGFSLHSLPKALPFYLKLGMKDFGVDEEKEGLHYLEMPEDVAEVFYDEV